MPSSPVKKVPWISFLIVHRKSALSTKTVESRRETLWWIEHMSYPVSEFGTVHFGIDGSHQNGWSYYVQLVGETTLKIPLKPGLTIRSADKTDARTLARRVGKYLDLPVVEDT